MMDCPRCSRPFPEVHGAPDQACPHCGLVFATAGGESRSAADEPPIDPVSALAHAASVVKRDYFRLVLAWSPVVIVSALLGWITLRYATSLGLPPDLSSLTPSQALPFLGVALPLWGASMLVEFALWARVASIAGAHPSRAPVTAALGLGALLTVVYFAGFALLILPFFVFLHWFAYAPAALAEGKSIPQAFEASRAFAKRRRTYGFTMLLVIAWLAVLIAGYALGAVLASGLASLGVPPEAAEALGSAVGTWPFAPLVPLLPASYYALASASAPPAQPKSEPRPAPRARSTKCPSCGVLIPLDAPGPVTVTCPACGVTGRVL